jgi:hypothetical protein
LKDVFPLKLAISKITFFPKMAPTEVGSAVELEYLKLAELLKIEFQKEGMWLKIAYSRLAGLLKCDRTKIGSTQMW